MTAAVAPTTEQPQAPLITDAPEGSEFAYEEVKTGKGTQTLGEVPILVWKDADKMIDFYGKDGVLDFADGTSLRVSFQGIARRMKAAGKSDDVIKDAEIRFRPGKRAGGVSTPQSRAARAARVAVEKGADGDLVARLLEQLGEGKLSNEDLQSLVG